MPVRLRSALQLGTLFTIMLAIAVSTCLLCFNPDGHTYGGLGLAHLLAALLGIVALLLAAALYAVGVTLSHRISEMEKTARLVSAGRLDCQIPLDGPDELADISRVFNEMLLSLRSYVALLPVHENMKKELENLLRVAEDLRHRNLEISDSLQRLGRAQHQLLQKERMSSLGRMFAAVVHDLDEKLASLSAVSERALAAPENLAPPVRQDLEAIRGAAGSARNKLARFAAHQPCGERRQAELVNLRKVVDEAVAATGCQWGGASATGAAAIRVQNEIRGVPDVPGNMLDLIQMFSHVITNAVEAMPAGGTLTFRAVSRGPHAIGIEISDTGVGMPPSAVKRCLLPFFSTKDGAAGIGLSLAHGIVLEHGGKIGVESQVGAGTTIFIDLPAKADARLPDQPRCRSAPRVQPLRILAVEDDVWTRDMMVQHLGLDGHHVAVAGHGLEALQRMGAAAFDLIITDLAMPYMTGMELAAEVRAALPHLPIVLLSGFGELLHEQGATPPNVDVVLAKPFGADDLREALGRALQAHQRPPPSVPAQIRPPAAAARPA